jgi:hypothetical protein
MLLLRTTMTQLSRMGSADSGAVSLPARVSGMRPRREDLTGKAALLGRTLPIHTAQNRGKGVMGLDTQPNQDQAPLEEAS